MSYLPVRIGTLRAGQIITFDVFVKVNGKPLYYVRKEDPFDIHRMNRLKEKGVKKLFIREDQEQEYLKYLEVGLEILSEEGESLEKRADIAKDTLVTEAENIERALDNEKSYRKAEVRVGKVIEFLASDEGALKSILNSAGAAQDNSQHSANVSTLATALSLYMGISNSRELYDIALAGLVHDIGKQKMTVPHTKKYVDYTEEEKAEFKKHPQYGIDLLAAKKFITPGILRLVIDHEEVGQGKGFPERKQIGSLHITSQYFNLCNNFDRYATEVNLPGTEAIKTFKKDRAELFKPDHIDALAEVIMVEQANLK